MKKTKNFLYLFGVFLIGILLLIIILRNFTIKELTKSYTNSSKNQLIYANNNLAEKSKEIELLATSIMTDETVRFFKDQINAGILDEYEYVQTLKKIDDRITQVSFNSIGIEAIYVYWPDTDLIISTKLADTVKKNSWLKELKIKGRNWDNDANTVYFSTSYPYIDTSEKRPDYFVVIEMKQTYLEEIKNVVTNLHDSHALIRLPQGEYISDGSSLDKKIKKIVSLDTLEEDVKIEDMGIKILAEYNPINRIQIISYFDKGTFIEPVSMISSITFISTFLILSVGLLLMFLFYRNIFSHLDLLVRKFRKVENGNLSTKITKKTSNEFNYVFEQFNQMVTGVDYLLLSLNNEYKRRDLAEKKQLQSQINPHFLYNSLFYIISVSENPDAVKAMSSHLAEYYQYRTNASDLVIIEEEVKFAESYLAIIAMRKSMKYEIKVDDNCLDEMILPLVIQPLLENAIEHGIEKKEGARQVSLSILEKEGFYEFCVEDDGEGLTSEEIKKLFEAINSSNEDKHSSVGLWNVNQRLINYYGHYSGIKIEKSKNLGGLKVRFLIKEDSL